MPAETIQRPSPEARPGSSWDDDDVETFNSPSYVPGSVAWNILTHGERTAIDVYTLMNMPRPDGLEAEDMRAFMWETIHDAARIGYLVGKIDIDSFESSAHTVLNVGQVSRAVAALIDVTLLDPEPRYTTEGKP